MSHVGAEKLKPSGKVPAQLERQMRPARRSVAMISKTVREYRRQVPTREIDVTQLVTTTQVQTHTETVRCETWSLFGIAVYSREIIIDSNL